MTHEFKVGDRVQVLDPAKHPEITHFWPTDSSADHLIGIETPITSIYPNGDVAIALDHHWKLEPANLELVKETKQTPYKDPQLTAYAELIIRMHILMHESNTLTSEGFLSEDTPCKETFMSQEQNTVQTRTVFVNDENREIRIDHMSFDQVLENIATQQAHKETLMERNVDAPIVTAKLANYDANIKALTEELVRRQPEED